MPADKELGPKMRALTEHRRAFVVAWFGWEGNSRKAVQAAFPNMQGDASAKTYGQRLMHAADIQEAIHEYAATCLKTEQLILAKTGLDKLLSDPSLDPNVKAKLIFAVYDRSGFSPKIEKHLVVEHRDRAAEIRGMIALARQLGQDPREVLRGATDITDADFEVIPGRENLEPVYEGLEDVL